MGRKPTERDKRHTTNRTQRSKILIVCEDSKSSPSYFKNLINVRFRGIVNQVEVRPSSEGPTPDMVLKSAQNYIRDNEGVYDHVYCVIDRDNHEDWHNRLQNFKTYRKVPITAIVSYPCFEYWLLLHFIYTAKPFPKYADIRPDLKEQLQRYGIQNYDKGSISEELFCVLNDHERYKKALEHSERSIIDADKRGNMNPSTEIHTLIEAITKLTTAAPTS